MKSAAALVEQTRRYTKGKVGILASVAIDFRRKWPVLPQPSLWTRFLLRMMVVGPEATLVLFYCLSTPSVGRGRLFFSSRLVSIIRLHSWFRSYFINIILLKHAQAKDGVLKMETAFVIWRFPPFSPPLFSILHSRTARAKLHLHFIFSFMCNMR